MARIPPHLYLLHLLLMLSPAVFAIALHFFVLPQNPDAAVPKEQGTVYQVVAAGLAVVAVGLSQLIPRFIFRGEKSIPMAKYATMKIVQWALLEGAALFIGVAYFVTQQKNMLISLGVLIALMAFMRPTADEVAQYNVK